MDRETSIEFGVKVDEGPPTARIPEPPPTVRVLHVSADDIKLSMAGELDDEAGDIEEVAPGNILETFEATR